MAKSNLELFVLTALCSVLTVSHAKPPHILLVVADDYGFADVGYHGSEIRTPTLDHLASEGVKLENYYVQPICTPSRSQLLSGRYQIHTGLQHEVIHIYQRNGLPLEFRTLADHLKDIGYATHMVGKWHLGFFKKEYTPTYRGFDTFFGFYSGNENYTTHLRCGADGIWHPPGSACGQDFHENEATLWNATEYSARLFASRVAHIVQNHNAEQPMFIYLPFQSVHAPLQVPEEYKKPYSFIDDPTRRTYAGMVSCMDEAIQNVTDAFKEAGIWNDTVMIFSTDNGGIPGKGGINYPLRGQKNTLWEGGLHGVGFVHSPLLEKRGYVNQELIHISDWMPTLLHLAGSSANVTDLDGVNQWETLSMNKPSARREILHNIDPLYPKRGNLTIHGVPFDQRTHAAIRVDDWKLITGDPGAGHWVPSPTSGQPVIPDPSEKDQNIWLFNIKDDPNEKKELSKSRPDIVKLLLERLSALNATAVPVRFPGVDPECNPDLHGGAWVPWVA